MDYRVKENLIKEEPCVYYEVCEKEEPDFSENSLAYTCGSFVQKSSPIANNEDLAVSPKKELDCEFSPCSSNVMQNLEKYESNEIKVKQEDCSYFIDSHDVDNFSDIDRVGVKRLHDEVVDEKCIGIEQLLKNSNEELRLYENVMYCHHCGFSSKFRGNLVRHIKFKHMPSRLFKCPSCPVKFRFRCDLKRHSSKHVNVELRKWRYNCSFCDFRTDKKYNICRHMFIAHVFDLPDGYFDTVKKCSFCSYETDVKSNLLSHFINNHKLDFIQRQRNNIFPCGLCSYFTTCKNTLILHIDGYHKKIRPYACHLCDYAASRPTDLKIHISAKHEKITPFKCEICSYATGYKKHLGRHILSQHINKKERKKHVRRYKAKHSEDYFEVPLNLLKKQD